jgi:hypothetical protein
MEDSEGHHGYSQIQGELGRNQSSASCGSVAKVWSRVAPEQIYNPTLRLKAGGCRCGIVSIQHDWEHLRY